MITIKRGVRQWGGGEGGREGGGGRGGEGGGGGGVCSGQCQGEKTRGQEEAEVRTREA